MASQPNSDLHSARAGKVIVAEGMRITELSEELLYNPMGIINCDKNAE